MLWAAGCALPPTEIPKVPTRAAGWRDRGWIDYLDGDATRARADFEHSLALHSGDPRVLLGLANLAQVEARPEAARTAWLAILQKADRRDPWTPAIQEIAAGAIEILTGEARDERTLAAQLAALELTQFTPGTVDHLLAARARSARRQGDEVAAQTLDRRRGCPNFWQLAGPYGHLPHLDLDRPLPPEPATPSQGHRVAAPACRLDVNTGQIRPGVAHAQVQLKVERTSDLRVTVESDQPWHLVIDRRTVWRNEGSASYPAREQTVEMRLVPGWHQLLLRVAAPATSLPLSVRIVSQSGGVTFDAAPHPPYGSPPTEARAIDLSPLPRLDGRLALLNDFVVAYRALRSGNSDLGAEAIERLVAGAPRFVPGLLVAAQLASEDPSVPARFGTDRARGLLERVVEIDPHAERARTNLALMELQQDHAKEALARLGEAEGWRAHLARYQAYHALGWLVEAEQALLAAHRANPEACPPVEAALEFALERHATSEGKRLAAELVRCDSRSDRQAALALSNGNARAAIQEYQRLLRLDPEREGWRSGLERALTAIGDAPAARLLLVLLIEDNPRLVTYRIRLADLLARDRRDQARAILAEGIALAPEALELHRALLALDGQSPIDRFRIDGKQVIAEFAQSGRRYPTPAVILLDRTVSRVFPTGAQLTLTHNIIRVQTKEGIDQWGEVTIPEGAEILTLRTLKADGSTREPEPPDSSGDKRSISAPDLEPGDCVEFEYLDPVPAPGAFPDGFLGERFYFQSYDAPLDRTEFVLATPREMGLQIDLRGPAPAAKVESMAGLLVRTWADREKAQLVAEPAQTPFVEKVASVRVGSGVTFKAWRDYLRELQWGTLRSNPELRRLARQLGTPEAIDRWVRAHIQQSGSLEEPATSILTRGEGNRISLERALLRTLGIPSEVWLARTKLGARLEGPLPDLENYEEALLALTPTSVLAPRFRHAPFRYASPLLQGQSALVLDDQPEPRFVTVTPSAPMPEQRRVVLEAQLAADGSAEVTVHETLSGWPALEWREGIDRLDPNRLNSEFEQHTLGFYFPGASLIELRHDSPADDARPVELRYRFHAPNFARAVGKRLFLSVPYPALLRRHYISTAGRSMPLQLSPSPEITMMATLLLPQGATAEPTPPVELSDPNFGRFAQHVDYSPGRLRVHSTFFLAAERVAPERYEAFAKYSEAVDDAEAHAAEVQLK